MVIKKLFGIVKNPNEWDGKQETCVICECEKVVEFNDEYCEDHQRCYYCGDRVQCECYCRCGKVKAEGYPLCNICLIS